MQTNTQLNNNNSSRGSSADEKEDNKQQQLPQSTKPKKEFQLGIQYDDDKEEYDGNYSDSGEESEADQAQTNYDEDGDEDQQLVPEDGESKGDKKQKEKKGAKKTDKKVPAKQIVKRKPYKLVMNVSDTQYPVVRFVGKKLFKWKLCYDAENLDCDLVWTDNAVNPEQLGKMQPHQKINHFPGMFVLARKNYLAKNLKKMKKQFPEQFKFFPQTWLLPAEYNDLRSEFEKTSKGKCKTFIVKPEASCQGRGIFLTRNLDDLTNSDHYVVQRYLNKPYLIDGLKFDFRIYVLLAGCDPMRIYVFKEGLARLATEEYEAPNRDNLDNLCMHLTNYAINKDNPNFEFNEDENNMDIGHKRSMTSVMNLLKEQGHDIEKLWEQIKDILIKTIVSAQPTLSHHYKSCQPDNYMNNMCFEILGFDVILDSHLRPWLLEINHTPSFTTDTPLDSLIKKNCIRDAIILMNINNKTRNEIISLRKEQLQKRVLTGKKVKLTPEEKMQEIKKAMIKRDEYESAHLGNYERVYPLDYDVEDIYVAMQQHALVLYENWTGANIRRIPKKDQAGNSIGGNTAFNTSVKPQNGIASQPRNSIVDKSKPAAAVAKLPDRRISAAKPAPQLMRANQSKNNFNPNQPQPGKIDPNINMEGEDGQIAPIRQPQRFLNHQTTILTSTQTGGNSSDTNNITSTPSKGGDKISENNSGIYNKPPSPLNLGGSGLQNDIRRQYGGQKLAQMEEEKQQMIKKYAQYAIDVDFSTSSIPRKHRESSNGFEKEQQQQPTSQSGAYSYIRQSSNSQSITQPQQQQQMLNQLLQQSQQLQQQQQSPFLMNSGRQQLTPQQQQQILQQQSIMQQQQVLLQQAKMLPGITKNLEDQSSGVYNKKVQDQQSKLPKSLQNTGNNNGLYLQPKLFDLNMLTKSPDEDQQQRKDGGRIKQVVYSNVVYLGNQFDGNIQKSQIGAAANNIGNASAAAGNNGVSNYYSRRK